MTGDGDDGDLLVVDGQTFRVRARPDEPGTYDYTWLSGPNEGYGFTSARSRPTVSAREDHEHAIRHFLAGVDPDSGFLG